jgi:hypothetical protein
MNVWVKNHIGGAILAGGIAAAALSAAGQAPATVPDPQVESNVLRALANAPELSTQNIQSSSVYGVVTLTGNVHDEALRTKAENLVARAQGVKKVVDELSLGDAPAIAASNQSPQNQYASQTGEQPDPGQNQPVLLSDGTYGPAPDGSGAQTQQQMDAQNGPAGPPNANPIPPSGQYAPSPTSARMPLSQSSRPGSDVPGGQQAGIPVIVPAGAMLRIRINRGLDSNHIQLGAQFDGTVLTDIIADGVVAVPRGATVTGEVVDAKKAGVFKGEGELALKLDTLTLGGNVYPLVSDIWNRNGRDKTAGTVNRTVGTSAVGALFGALAGGGTGAAIGAGVGAGVGLAGSAASPRGQIIIPPESVLNFHTAAPMPIRTVSEQEMSRLLYSAGPQGPPPGPRRVRYYSPYYGYYYGPPQ